MNEVVNYRFQEYLSIFHPDFDYKGQVISFLYVSDVCLEEVKKEILNNLILLSSDSKIVYFEKLKYDINNLLSKKPNFKESKVVHLCKEYNTKIYLSYDFRFVANDLYKILSNSNTYEEDKKEKYLIEFLIRQDFYDFYYCTSLKVLLYFIYEQEIKIFPEKTNIKKQTLSKSVIKLLEGEKNMVLNPKPMIDATEQYINSWSDCTVTVSQWLENSDIDISEELSYLDVSEEKLEEINQHQYNLYCQIVNNIFTNSYKVKLGYAHVTHA